MVSNIGYRLNSFQPITGFGMRRRRRTTTHRPHHHVEGHGLPRKIIGSVINHLGHALVNKVASAVSGSGSFHLTGGLRRKRVTHRKPRTTLFGGLRRPRVHAVRHRRPRTTLLGTGRRRRIGRPRVRRVRIMI